MISCQKKSKSQKKWRGPGETTEITGGIKKHLHQWEILVHGYYSNADFQNKWCIAGGTRILWQVTEAQIIHRKEKLSLQDGVETKLMRHQRDGVRTLGLELTSPGYETHGGSEKPNSRKNKGHGVSRR